MNGGVEENGQSRSKRSRRRNNQEEEEDVANDAKGAGGAQAYSDCSSESSHGNEDLPKSCVYCSVSVSFTCS